VYRRELHNQKIIYPKMLVVLRAINPILELTALSYFNYFKEKFAVFKIVVHE
jgi:hypothetical protein